MGERKEERRRIQSGDFQKNKKFQKVTYGKSHLKGFYQRNQFDRSYGTCYANQQVLNPALLGWTYLTHTKLRLQSDRRKKTKKKKKSTLLYFSEVGHSRQTQKQQQYSRQMNGQDVSLDSRGTWFIETLESWLFKLGKLIVNLSLSPIKSYGQTLQSNSLDLSRLQNATTEDSTSTASLNNIHISGGSFSSPFSHPILPLSLILPLSSRQTQFTSNQQSLGIQVDSLLLASQSALENPKLGPIQAINLAFLALQCQPKHFTVSQPESPLNHLPPTNLSFNLCSSPFSSSYSSHVSQFPDKLKAIFLSPHVGLSNFEKFFHEMSWS